MEKLEEGPEACLPVCPGPGVGGSSGILQSRLESDALWLEQRGTGLGDTV